MSDDAEALDDPSNMRLAAAELEMLGMERYARIIEAAADAIARLRAPIPREPTAAMFIAGTKALAAAEGSFARFVWYAMYDAAQADLPAPDSAKAGTTDCSPVSGSAGVTLSDADPTSDLPAAPQTLEQVVAKFNFSAEDLHEAIRAHLGRQPGAQEPRLCPHGRDLSSACDACGRFSMWETGEP